MARAVFGVQLICRETSMDMILMLVFNEAIDQLAMADSVYWHGHVLRRALDFEVEGQREVKWNLEEAG